MIKVDAQIFMKAFLFAGASGFSVTDKAMSLSPRAPTGPPDESALFQSVFESAAGNKSFLQSNFALRSVSLHSLQHQPLSVPSVIKFMDKPPVARELQTNSADAKNVQADDSFKPVKLFQHDDSAADVKLSVDAGDKNDKNKSAPPSVDSADKGKDSASKSVSAPDSSSVQLSGQKDANISDESKKDDGNADVQSVASRVEFLLVQFMFFLQFGVENQSKPSQTGGNKQMQDMLKIVASAFDGQTQMFLTDAAGSSGQNVVPADAGIPSLSNANATGDAAGNLFTQLTGLQGMMQKLLDSMAGKLKEGDAVTQTGVSTDASANSSNPMLLSLDALLKELKGVVEDVKVSAPPANNDAGSKTLKELAKFAEDVKLLMQKVAEHIAAQMELNSAEAKTGADELKPVQLQDVLSEAQNNKPADIEAKNVNLTEEAPKPASDDADKTQVFSVDDKTSFVNVSEEGKPAGVQNGDDVKSAQNVSDAVSSVKDSVKSAVDTMLKENVQTSFVNAGKEAAKEIQLKNSTIEAMLSKGQAQTLSPLEKGAAQILKSTAALSFGMDFKELLNVPKTFAEELQNIFALKDMSVSGIQVVKDALVNAVVSGEKLQLALSDVGKQATEEMAFSLKDLSGKETGLETESPRSPSPMPILQEFQRALQQNTPQNSVKDTAPVAAKTEENLMQFSQSLIKSGQLLLSTGVADMRIRLKPEHLGDLRLRIMMEEGILKATFQAQSQQVKEILESSLSALKQSLKDQGIQVEKFVVTTGNPGDYAQTGQNAEADAAWNQKGAQTVWNGGGGETDELSLAVAQTQVSRVKLSTVDYFV